ncbi:unnamed protein product (macronuclear) [Paramecium tetraurelia]|uniref:Uncharacterized protein n=1 Tax=Paramecium tetraurelia TaxID=5888 RepID=A0CAR1_PARTE|nr:uncharacterized protein GSPATT00036659001 [Paramecium tetraurelia]CAK67878.1 unnamed protein product [Paramecium tetraurelia]|eukprot:XP_001435275.1 hypothetical protein (macronuclear) [Paramecium tetraurelia strain d4-2]
MGACFAKKADREAGIKQQIEKTIIEQQKLKEEEEEIQFNQGNKDYSTKRSMHAVQTTMYTNQEKQDEGMTEIIQEEEKQTEKPAKKAKSKPTKDDINYYKKYEHVLHLKAIIVELVKNQVSHYYSLMMRVDYKDYIGEVKMNGILITQSDFHHFNILPQKFSDANQYSRFSTFFSNDNYFNADKDSVNNFNAFEKLLPVERLVRMRQAEKRFRRKQTIFAEKESPSPVKNKLEFIDSKQQEMLEVITIVDIEEQERFQCLLFHILVQQQFPELNHYLVFIQNTTFLFDRPPQFDAPNIYRIALFYDRLDFSLKDLQAVLTKENKELSPHLHRKLALNLLQIIHNCYSRYIFRLNFTLSTIFYCAKSRVFKLESFGRLKSMIPFHNNQDMLLKSVEEKKITAFRKALKRDLFAVCDLIIYFKRIEQTPLRSIQALRKKFLKVIDGGNDTQEQNDSYIHMAEERFSHNSDQYLFEFVKMVLFTTKIDSTEKIMQNLLSIIESLSKQISSYEFKLEFQEDDKHKQAESPKKNEQVDVINLEEINLSQSDLSNEENTNENYLQSFDIDFQKQYQSLAKNKEQLSEAESIYKDILYQSLFYHNEIYLDELNKKLNVQSLNKLQQTQIIVLNAFSKIKMMKDDSWEVKSQQLSQFVEEAILIMNSINEDSYDNFHISMLFQILSISQRKPLVILNQLQRCMTKQLELKLKLNNKFRGKNAPKGLIEQKKYVMVQTMYAQSYLNSNHYFEAITKIQKIVGFQLKNFTTTSLLYGYSLMISGEIARLSSQPLSAMLNLEMSLAIYNQYFPESIIQATSIEENNQQGKLKKETDILQDVTVQLQERKFENLSTSNLAKVEFLLGMSYFDSQDQENALKRLRRAQKLMMRSYGIFADEVISLVLYQLNIYVLQDDVGSVMKIAIKYSSEMSKQYKLGKQFKRKCIAKLQFIIGCIFQFCGSYLSALRFIERSNRTLSNAKLNNFVIQSHYQAKKMIIIEQVKKAFRKIKCKQSLRGQMDLNSFQSLHEVLGSAFQNQFFCQPIKYHASVLFKKYSKYILQVQGLIRIGENDKAIHQIEELLKLASKVKKDELYAYLKDKLVLITIESTQAKDQIQNVQRLIEIHDRYLQFPYKQIYKLRSLIILISLFAMTRDLKKFNETQSQIDDFIQEIYQIFNWQVAAPTDHTVNQAKFERLKNRNKVNLLFQIQQIMDLIQYFYTIRKKLFNSFDNQQQLKEVGSQVLKRLTGQPKPIFLKYFDRKQECLYGVQSQIKIKNTEKENDFIKLHENENKIEVPKQPEQAEEQSNHKLVFDLRSYEEIALSRNTQRKKSHHHEKQQSQDLQIEKKEISEIKEIKKSKHKRNVTEVTAATLNTNKKKQTHKLNPFETTIKSSKK